MIAAAAMSFSSCQSSATRCACEASGCDALWPMKLNRIEKALMNNRARSCRSTRPVFSSDLADVCTELRAPETVDNTYVITYDSGMTTKTATQARADLYRLLDQVSRTHEPVAITGRRHNGVLIAEEDWRAIQETLYLLSIPGMRESIRKGLRTPLSKTSKKAGW